MSVTIGPCDWDVPDPTCCDKWDTLTEEEKERAKRWAAFLLWSATGRQLGKCRTTLRPCRKSCGDNDWWPPRPDGRLYGYGRWVAMITDPAKAAWAGGLCGCGQHTCTCGRLCQIHLPGTLPEPVEVLINGHPVPLSSFRVDNGHWLVWLNGQDVELPDGTRHDCFPACQDLGLPPTECGTWQITYRHGIPVPAEGLLAAAELACEVAKACAGAGPGECRLPSNVVSMTRAGITYDYARNDGTVTVPGGRVLRFNIPIVDMWVQAMNPYGVTDQAWAWSPDLPQAGRIQTWP